MKLFSSRIGARVSEVRKNSIRKNGMQRVRTEFLPGWGGLIYLSDQELWVCWWHMDYSDYHYFEGFHTFHPDC